MKLRIDSAGNKITEPKFDHDDHVEHKRYGRGTVFLAIWDARETAWTYHIRNDKGPIRIDSGFGSVAIVESALTKVDAISQLGELA